MHHVLRKSQQWDQVFFTTTVQVYDPFALQKATSPDQEPDKVSALGYQQNIYWKINELLVVETFNDEGELLHFYYESNGDVVNVATQQERLFLKTDILFDYFRFIVSRKEDWEKALQEVHIDGKEISLHHNNDYNILYRVGDLQSDHFALIDKENFLLKALQYSLQSGENRHLIRIVFQELIPDQKLEYPKQTDYFLDDRLFKRVIINSMQHPEKLPLDILRQKAVKWSQTHFASLQIDYTK